MYGPEDLTMKNMAAWGRWGPSAYELNRLYNPAYNSLQNQNTEQSIFGTQGGWKNRTISINQGHKWVPFQQTFYKPGQAGLLDIYKRAGADLGNFNREQQAQDLSAFRQNNPLYGSIMNSAQQGLDQGGELDPSTRRMLEQASIGDASMRGFGHSPLDAYQAYASLGQAAEQRQQQRQQFALQAQGMYNPSLQPSLATSLGPAIGMAGSAFSRTASTPAINPFAMSGITSTPSDNTTSNILGAVSGGLMNMAGGLAGSGRANAGSVRGPDVQGPGGNWYGPAMGNGGQYYRPY